MPTLFRRRSDALAADNQTADEVVRFGETPAQSNGSGRIRASTNAFARAFWACIWRRPGVNATTGLRRRKARWR